jgi:hypothetical protein
VEAIRDSKRIKTRWFNDGNLYGGKGKPANKDGIFGIALIGCPVVGAESMPFICNIGASTEKKDNGNAGEGEQERLCTSISLVAFAKDRAGC